MLNKHLNISVPLELIVKLMNIGVSAKKMTKQILVVVIIIVTGIVKVYQLVVKKYHALSQIMDHLMVQDMVAQAIKIAVMRRQCVV